MVCPPTGLDRLPLSSSSGDEGTTDEASPSVVSRDTEEVHICRDVELIDYHFVKANDKQWRRPANRWQRQHSEQERQGCHHRGRSHCCVTASIRKSQGRLHQDPMRETIGSLIGTFDTVHNKQRRIRSYIEWPDSQHRVHTSFASRRHRHQRPCLPTLQRSLRTRHSQGAPGSQGRDDEAEGSVEYGSVRQPQCTQEAANTLALDGAQEEPESKETAQQRAQDGSQADPGGRKAATSLSVADRILGFERKGTLSALPKPVKRHRHSEAVYDEDAAEDSPDRTKESLPIVFPLHVRKFQRRDSKAAAMIQKPDTPLYRSEPDHDPTIHSPTPQRPIPALKTPPGTPPPVEAAVSVAKTALQQANAQASVAKTALEQPADTIPEPVNLSSQTAGLRQSRSGRVAERQREIESLAVGNSAIGQLQRSNTQPRAKDSEAAIPTSRINPFAHFHGTRGYCVRHGRKSGLGNPKGATSTKDMFERGRNGMLIPVGLPARRQMEATSPWIYTGSCSKLTCFIDDIKSSADACPDCVAELNIKKKELVEKGDFGRESLVGMDFHQRQGDGEQHAAPKTDNQAAAAVVQEQPVPITQHEEEAAKAVVHGPAQVVESGKPKIKNMAEPAPIILSDPPGAHDGMPDSKPGRYRSWNSTDVEPPVSSQRSASSGRPSPTQSTASSHISDNAATENNVAPSPDRQPRAVHFRALSTSRDHDSNHDHDIVVQRDLGDGLDAMILERGGRLERVVMNSRKGGATAEVMARLARELSQVSSAISTTNPPHRRERECTDGSLDEIIARRKSVPELEHLLRDAADAREVKTHGHLHSQADGSSEHIPLRTFSAAEGSTCSDDDEIEELLPRTPSQIERITMRQTIEDDYRALKRHLDSAAATVDADYRHQPTGLGYRWPTPAQYRALSFPTPRRNKQNLGSKTFPIRIASECEGECRKSSSPHPEPELTTCTSPSTSGLPTLPSHILRAQDMTMELQTPSIPPSPLLFTASTVPSLAPSVNNSALSSPETTPPDLVGHGNTDLEPSDATCRPPTPMPPPPQPLGSLSQVQADSQIIRQVIRMEREKEGNKAVQEAAAVERAVRRKRVEGVVRSLSE